MHRRHVHALAALFASCLAAGVAAAAEPGPNSIVLGTGGPQTVFESFGKALCAQAATIPGLACETRQTSLWQENLGGLEDKDFNFSMLASDRVADAAAGVYEVPGIDKLRAVLALPGAQLTILARPDAGIAVADNLRGKRVRTAPPSTLGPFLYWLREGNWGETDLAHFGPLGFENSVNSVCDGAADAFVFIDGHPGEMTDIATKRCPLRLVPVADEAAVKVTASQPEYVATAIAGGLYQGQDKPVASLGSYTVLLTIADVPDALVERWVAAILARYGEARAAQAPLAAWPVEQLRPRAFPVPAHPGADRAFAARGLLPK